MDNRPSAFTQTSKLNVNPEFHASSRSPVQRPRAAFSTGSAPTIFFILARRGSETRQHGEDGKNSPAPRTDDRSFIRSKSTTRWADRPSYGLRGQRSPERTSVYDFPTSGLELLAVPIQSKPSRIHHHRDQHAPNNVPVDLLTR